MQCTIYTGHTTIQRFLHSTQTHTNSHGLLPGWFSKLCSVLFIYKQWMYERTRQSYVALKTQNFTTFGLHCQLMCARKREKKLERYVWCRLNRIIDRRLGQLQFSLSNLFKCTFRWPRFMKSIEIEAICFSSFSYFTSSSVFLKSFFFWSLW